MRAKLQLKFQKPTAEARQVCHMYDFINLLIAEKSNEGGFLHYPRVHVVKRQEGDKFLFLFSIQPYKFFFSNCMKKMIKGM